MTESRFALVISISSLLTVLIIAFFGKKNEPVVSSRDMPNPVVFTSAKTIPLPEAMEFAGEAVPLEISDVAERLDRELHINSYWHNNTIFLLKRANRWFPMIEEVLKENGIPEDFKYLALIESGLENVTSYAGAVGFWQILKSTGKEYGLEVNRDIDQRYHPELATQAAAKYLKRSYQKFNDWTLVAASYNRGMAGVNRALENQKVDNYYDLMLNEETSRYVFRILAIKRIVEDPQAYGFNIDSEHLYPPYQYKYDTLRESKNMVEYAKELGVNYKTLRIYNPWLQDEDIKVRKGDAYVISLPKDDSKSEN